jgi:hypothetical protein
MNTLQAKKIDTLSDLEATICDVELESQALHDARKAKVRSLRLLPAAEREAAMIAEIEAWGADEPRRIAIHNQITSLYGLYAERDIIRGGKHRDRVLYERQQHEALLELKRTDPRAFHARRRA